MHGDCERLFGVEALSPKWFITFSALEVLAFLMTSLFPKRAELSG
jgi:hypothetical protein